MKHVDNSFLNELPEGCKAFGASSSSSSKLKMMKRLWTLAGNDINSLLVLANSKTAEIKGISAAGSTKESRRYTAAADAELLLLGPSAQRKWPLPPLPAGVSPALISHVAANLLEVKTLVLSVGLSQVPSCPYLAVDGASVGPSECLTTGKAMNINRVDTLWRKGLEMGLRMCKPLLISECVPGGTTTALAVLTGLGVSVDDLISSSSRTPPTGLKKKLVAKGLNSAGLGIHPAPKDLLAAVGDPFQPFAVGLLLGAREAEQPVLLGGGGQMVAVLATALASMDDSLRDKFVEGISIATTAWLANESFSSFQTPSAFSTLIERIEGFFEVSLLGLSCGLRFCRSSKKVLRDYEHGFVKEGVGAGAFTLLAQLNGFTCQKLLEECEEAVDSLYRIN
ncbi:nicotinate-nucleotide--dimethylbenzimidazole phosphoribosyltransferase [Prochlorococcus marinus]|uniref:nicotinate-nucleotide--dimethylbenzimidazole phosphoribosyltransferase n=1 Tax=Prochlorococcus marinus TaxID=1219 RepID=UPI0022B4AE4B|nr:TIGR00303 family protein [Prochlorococcus marinus]